MSHDDIARTFDGWASDGRDQGMQEEHGDVVAQVLAELSIGPGEQILDLGCGNGWATRLLAKAAAGASAVGVDVSPAMVARAEELHSFTIRARYEVARFEELPFDDAQFSRAFSMEALYYAVDLERALGEIARVLRPGAPFDAVIDYYKESPHTETWRAACGVDTHWLGRDEWCAALERAGFGEVGARQVVDSRGAGEEAAFEVSQCYPDFATWKAVREAGSLWLHGVKPA